MRALIAILCLVAHVAHAQPVDAPLVPAVAVKAGEVLSYDGVCMDNPKAIATGQRIAACEASLLAVQDKTIVSTPLLLGTIGVVVTLLTAAFAGGYAVAKSGR